MNQVSESKMILDFFDTENDLLSQYEIYQHFRVHNYVVAVEMRKLIEEKIKENNGYHAWWLEVLTEERFSDFSD